MATVAEKFKGTSGNLESHQIVYLVQDASSDIDALNAVEAAAPATYDGLTRDNISYEEIRWPDLWEVTVSYTKRQKTQPETSETAYSFDISTESVKIVTSLDTVGEYFPVGAAKQEFYGAINVDDKQNPQGVDVRVPVGSFTITYYPAQAIITSAYQKLLLEMVGKVNSVSFNDHAAGEVLFVGASGSARNVTDWEISYRFEVRPNKTGITIGDITGIAVDGWDVLWVFYGERVKDTGALKYSKKPTQVNVERVYERADLNLLFA